jgi:hypothetical protein
MLRLYPMHCMLRSTYSFERFFPREYSELLLLPNSWRKHQKLKIPLVIIVAAAAPPAFDMATKTRFF